MLKLTIFACLGSEMKYSKTNGKKEWTCKNGFPEYHHGCMIRPETYSSDGPRGRH